MPTLVQADISTSGMYDANGRPVILTAGGALTTDGSAVVQPISGSVTTSGSLGRTWSLSSGTDSVAAVQSGTWTFGRTWTLSSGTDSIAAVQSGAWSVTANAGTNLNTSLLALDSTVAKDSSLSTINTSINTLLKPANTLAAVTTLGTITNALPIGSNSIGQVTSNAGTNLNTSALNLETTQSGFKTANHTDLGTLNTSVGTGNSSLSSIDGKLTTSNTNTGNTATSVSSIDTKLTTTNTNTSNTNTSVQNTQGTVAAGTAATKSNLGGGVYNTTLPALTNGQGAAVQFDANARTLGSNVSLDSYKNTYSVAVTGLVPVASATDVFTLTGSSTKIIRILHIEIAYTQSAANIRDFLLIKRSTANSGGTATQPTIAPHDSTNASVTAVVNAYTANPTLGTAVGTLRSGKLWAATATGGSSALINNLVWDFGNRPGQSVILRGTSQVLAVNLNATTVTTGAINISIEWTEE